MKLSQRFWVKSGIAGLVGFFLLIVAAGPAGFQTLGEKISASATTSRITPTQLRRPVSPSPDDSSQYLGTNEELFQAVREVNKNARTVFTIGGIADTPDGHLARLAQLRERLAVAAQNITELFSQAGISGTNIIAEMQRNPKGFVDRYTSEFVSGATSESDFTQRIAIAQGIRDSVSQQLFAEKIKAFIQIYFPYAKQWQEQGGAANTVIAPPSTWLSDEPAPLAALQGEINLIKSGKAEGLAPTADAPDLTVRKSELIEIANQVPETQIPQALLMVSAFNLGGSLTANSSDPEIQRMFDLFGTFASNQTVADLLTKAAIENAPDLTRYILSPTEGTINESTLGQVSTLAEKTAQNQKELVTKSVAVKEEIKMIHRAYQSTVTFDRSTGKLYYSTFVYLPNGIDEKGHLVADKTQPAGVISFDPQNGQYNGRLDLRVINPKLKGDLTVNPRTGDLVLWYDLRKGESLTPVGSPGILSQDPAQRQQQLEQELKEGKFTPSPTPSQLVFQNNKLKPKFALTKIAVSGDGGFGGEFRVFGKTLRYNPVTRALEVPIRIRAKNVIGGPSGATIYVDAKGNITGEIPFRVNGNSFGLYLDPGGNIALGTEITQNKGTTKLGAISVTGKGVVTGSVDVLKIAGVKGTPGFQLVFSTKGGFQGINIPTGSFGVFIGKDGNLSFTGYIPAGPIPIPVGLSFNERGDPTIRFPGGKTNVGKWPVVGSALTAIFRPLFGCSGGGPTARPAPQLKEDGTIDLATRFYATQTKRRILGIKVGSCGERWNNYAMKPDEQKKRAELIEDIYKTTLGRPPKDDEFLTTYLYINENESDPATRQHWTSLAINANKEEYERVKKEGGPEVAWKKYEEEQQRIAIENNPIGILIQEAEKTADPTLLDEAGVIPLEVQEEPFEGSPSSRTPVASSLSPSPTASPQFAEEESEVFVANANVGEPPAFPVDDEDALADTATVSAPEPSITATQLAQGGLRLSLRKGWNLLTVPQTLQSTNVSPHPFKGFEAVRSLAYRNRYYNSEFELPESGVAFWVFSSEDGEKSLSDTVILGEPVPDVPVIFELAKGWNLVGNPYPTPITLTDKTIIFKNFRGDNFSLTDARTKQFISPIFVYDTSSQKWRELGLGDQIAPNQAFAIQLGGTLTLTLRGR